MRVPQKRSEFLYTTRPDPGTMSVGIRRQLPKSMSLICESSQHRSESVLIGDYSMTNLKIRVDEDVFGLDVAVRYTQRVQVRNGVDELIKDV